jgi:hypothetical protein
MCVQPAAEPSSGSLEVEYTDVVELDLDKQHFDDARYLIVVRAIQRDGQGVMRRVLPPSSSIWARRTFAPPAEISPLIAIASALPGAGLERYILWFDPLAANEQSVGAWLLAAALARPRLLALAALAAALPAFSGKVTGVEIPLPPTPPLPPETEDPDQPPTSDDDVPQGDDG